MSAYPLLLHIVACLWYILFWNHFLNNFSDKDDLDPVVSGIHEMGTRFLTNWNMVNQFNLDFFIC